jgi:hypothetical protein
VAVVACQGPSSATADGAADGALRARTQILVAPDSYRSGTLSSEQAAAWVDKAAAALAPWYDTAPADQLLKGVRNVVEDHERQAGPIVSSVVVHSVSLGEADRSAAEVRFPRVSVTYRTEFANGGGQDGVTMCILVLHPSADGWRVADETCNESSG